MFLLKKMPIWQHLSWNNIDLSWVIQFTSHCMNQRFVNLFWISSSSSKVRFILLVLGKEAKQTKQGQAKCVSQGQTRKVPICLVKLSILTARSNKHSCGGAVSHGPPPWWCAHHIDWGISSRSSSLIKLVQTFPRIGKSTFKIWLPLSCPRLIIISGGGVKSRKIVQVIDGPEGGCGHREANRANTEKK